MAVQDVLPGKIEKARAKGDAAAIVRHDGRVEPRRRGDRLTVDCDQLERVDVDVEDMVVVRIEVRDRPLLDRTEVNLLTDLIVSERLPIDEEGELLPVAGGIGLRGDARERELATAGDLLVTNGRQRRWR